MTDAEECLFIQDTAEEAFHEIIRKVKDLKLPDKQTAVMSIAIVLCLSANTVIAEARISKKSTKDCIEDNLESIRKGCYLIADECLGPY